MLNPELKEGDRIVLIHMDGESDVLIGEKGTVNRVVTDPFEDDEMIYTVEWDNGSTLNLLSVTDSWIYAKDFKEKESLKEDEDSEIEYSKSIAKTSPFNATANATSAAMKAALSDYKEAGIIKIWPVPVGQSGSYKLPGVDESDKLKRAKPETQQRFIQWYDDVIINYDSVGTRGKTFEGLIAGIFGGNVLGNENISGDDRSDKTDVTIIEGPSKGQNLSVKFNKSFDPKGSQNIGGITRAVKKIVNSEENIFLKPILEDLPSVTRNRNGLVIKANAIYQIMSALYRNFNNPKVYDVVKEILTSDDSFDKIDWFVFSTEGNLNEILIYQYSKENIINHILNDVKNFTVTSTGMLQVKNLGAVNNNLLTVQFPQFTKTKRTTKQSKTAGIYSFADGTVVLSIKKGEKIVARVRRKIDGEIITYEIDVIDNSINLNRENKLDYENRAIIKDIRAIEQNKINIGNKKDETLSYLKKLSNEKQKDLFAEKAKLSKKGKESDISRDIEIMSLFGDRGENLNPFLVQYIRKNPDRFVKRVLDLYGDRPEIKDYIKSLTESILSENSIKQMDEWMSLQDMFRSGRGQMIFNFFEKVRQSGIVNMFASSSFIYSGGDYLRKFIEMEKYKGYEFDEDAIEELIELADNAKNEIIQMTIEVLENEGKEPTLENLNRKISKVAVDALRFFMMMYSHR